MGQQIALQQKPQIDQDSNVEQQQQNQNSVIKNRQGFLKISAYPFLHSTKIIQYDTSSTMYAEKCKSLQEQIIARKASQKYFTKTQVLDLIQSTVYTLVSLEQQNVIYKDITSQHIFLVQEKSRTKQVSSIKFKILPNELIQQTTFERLKRISKRVIQQQKSFTFSPQMIIALRARQKYFKDLSLLKKSSVFALGMVLLQTATLHLSCNFYDTTSFDIYQEVVEDNLIDVQKRYGEIVTRIIANMIDFDFEERIEGFTELAKWIIYELQNNEIPNEANKCKVESSKQIHVKTTSRSVCRQQINQSNIQTIPVCFSNIKTKQLLKQQQPILTQSKYQQQNTQNKINIKVRQVSVYIQKNSNLQSDKQNKSRLLYSPFLNSVRQSKVSEFQIRGNNKMDLVGQFSRRGLAFDSTYNKTKHNIFRDNHNHLPVSNYIRTQR